MNKTPTFSGEAVKRFIVASLAMAVALCLSTGPAAADDRNFTQEYLQCLDRSGGVTAEMINCILAETNRQDAKLNERYKKLILKLPKQRQTALVEAQRAWMRFRDANCGFYNDPEGGTVAQLIAHECFLKAVVDRAEELKLLTSDE